MAEAKEKELEEGKCDTSTSLSDKRRLAVTLKGVAKLISSVELPDIISSPRPAEVYPRI